jgi:hypothetical protein
MDERISSVQLYTICKSRSDIVPKLNHGSDWCGRHMCKGHGGLGPSGL